MRARVAYLLHVRICCPGRDYFLHFLIGDIFIENTELPRELRPHGLVEDDARIAILSRAKYKWSGRPEECVRVCV